MKFAEDQNCSVLSAIASTVARSPIVVSQPIIARFARMDMNVSI